MPLKLTQKRKLHNLYSYEAVDICHTDGTKKTVTFEKVTCSNATLLGRLAEQFNVSKDPMDWIYDHGLITTKYDDNGTEALLSVHVHRELRKDDFEKDFGIL